MSIDLEDLKFKADCCRALGYYQELLEYQLQIFQRQCYLDFGVPSSIFGSRLVSSVASMGITLEDFEKSTRIRDL